MKRFCLKFSFLVIVILLGIGVLGYFWIKNLTPQEFLQSNFVQEKISKKIGKDKTELLVSMPHFLGFGGKEMTYLTLFLNNTEIRPGGGFIGVYGVIRVNNGKMEVLKLEGSETLDRQTPEDWKISPPQILKDHLKVDRWYFRDANWSPDFVESSKNVLKLYKGENGYLADEIDAVVAFTPDVLETLLEFTGPLVVQDIEFNSANVTEKLEYEVEYGYDDKGISFHERKQIIKPFFNLLASEIYKDLFKVFNNLDQFEELLQEKHIMVYSLDSDLQEELDSKDWSGRVKQIESDYLMWVDANLAALKTDYAIDRTLHYSFFKQEDGKILATVEMEYKHNGSFDWRTTRYRTYARVFVPTGSKFVTSSGSMAWDQTDELGKIDQGEELNKKWFGSFISIEPGETGKLSFSYILPENISKQIESGLYTLFVQKQSGISNTGLTLDLKFDKNIETAEPFELEQDWGDVIYKHTGNLRLDRYFQIGFVK